MKTISFIIFLLLLVLAALFYFNSQPLEQEMTKSSSINQVSWQQSQSKDKLKKDKKEKNGKRQKFEQEITESIQKVDELKESITASSETDYISAYRDWQYFQNCYTDVEDFLKQKDPLDTLKERFANNPRESQSEPTAQQNTYYLHHVDICKGMIDNDEDDYYTNMERLETEFREIIPKTEEEKQLEQALLMQKQLRQLMLDFTYTSRKKSNLSSEQLQDINSQINQVTQNLLAIYDGKDELSEQENQLLQQYSQELDELNGLITKSQVVDNEQRDLINEQINKHLIAMEGFLKTVISPDAFLVIAGNLFRSEYYQKDSPVLAHIKQETQIWDSYYIDILNKITMPLIACSMNYPCDADSDYMLSYCLGLRDSMFNQACGMDLEDFYFNFYIGANQLNDVNTYFQYMVNTYGR
jgi:hypothetical protein